MMATGVYASGEYFDWGGTTDYELTLEIFEDIERGIISKDKAIEVLNDKVDELEIDKADLSSQLDNSTSDEEIKEALKSIISKSNAENGPSKKYNSLKESINSVADKYDIKEELGEQGKGQSNKELEQAIKDMEKIREEADDLRNKVNESK